jgi:signal transduction histidine kinase
LKAMFAGLDPMNMPASDGNGELWTKAFAEAKFPAFVISSAHQLIRANREGEAWISRNGGLLPILERRGDSDQKLHEVTSNGKMPEAVMLELNEGSTLVCLAPEGACGVRDYVRLYQVAVAQEEVIRSRDDRLEVYHELFTHDAPNYLTAIYGYLQMMQGQDLPREKIQKYVDTSIRQVESLNHLIDNTRNIRQMETMPRSMVIPMDLGAAIGKAISAVQASPKAKPAEIRSDVPAGAHRVMVEEQFTETFRIILNNGIAYSERPVISVSVQDGGEYWNIRFKDNGRGIPDDKKEFLFLRFHCLNKERKIRGSGISLSLAKVLTERQGGRIWVEDAVPGDHTKGSVFVVALPKA